MVESQMNVDESGRKETDDPTTRLTTATTRLSLGDDLNRFPLTTTATANPSVIPSSGVSSPSVAANALVLPNTNNGNNADTAASNAILQVNLALQLQQQLLQQQQQQQQQAAAAAVALLVAASQQPFNLIPPDLQATALAASLHGTPGFQPALISPPLFPPTETANLAPQALTLLQQIQQQQQQQQQLPPPQPFTLPNGIQLPTMTVQDRPHVLPVFNGVNPNYPGLRVLNTNPPVFAVDNFLTPLECQFLVTVAGDSFGPAPVVGKGAGEVSASRTSSTCYLAREDLPDYMRKVSLLTGKPMEHMELPQVGRYFPSQQYLQHFDAFDTATEDGRRFAANGGQRTVTVLVYLNDVPRGGSTRFPALNLDVQPRQGMALVFFPATVDGHLDKMALHAAMPAVDTKFVSQVWIRQSVYNGQPSKRLPHPMGAPFNPPLGTAPVPQPIAHLPNVIMTPPIHPPPQVATNGAPIQTQQVATGVIPPVPPQSGSAGNVSGIPNPFAAANLPATF